MANKEALGTMMDNAAALVEERIVRFARLLHDNAFAVGVAETADAVQALGAIAVTDISAGSQYAAHAVRLVDARMAALR